MPRLFSEVLDDYLELKEMDEFDHPDYVDGYTNKSYYNELQDLKGELNEFFTKD